MKAFDGLMKILFTITSLSLTIMLVISIVPIATGGISPNSDMSISTMISGNELILDGNIEITSTLNDPIEDLRIQVYCQSDTGLRLDLMDVVTEIVANATTPIPFHASVLLTDAAMFIIADNNGTVDGFYLPASVSIEGNYFHSMLGFRFVVDLKIPLSDTGTLNLDIDTNANGDVVAVDASIGDLSPGILSEMLVDATGSLTCGGNEIRIEIDRTGDSASIHIDAGGTEAIKDVIESILQACDEGEPVSLSFMGYDVELEAEQVLEFRSMIEGLVEVASQAGVI